MEAREGDTHLTIGGPRGSLVVPEDYVRCRVYVCGEWVCLPALRRRLESA